MKPFALLLLWGAAIAAPSDLTGIAHQDEHHHRGAHALPEQLVRQAPLVPLVEPYQEPEGPPQPYSFTYSAGRYPGHVDRTHSESRGVDGVVVGTFEYLDPLQRVVKVDYVADKNGFHPNVQGAGVPIPPRFWRLGVILLTTVPINESAAVVRAREQFFADSARIVAEQARIGQEHAALRAAAEAGQARKATGQQQYV